MSNRLDQLREERLQPKRINTTFEKLKRLGYHPSKDSVRVWFIFKGHKVILWPYSGWFSGKTVKDGRGFEKLLRQLTEQEK